MYIPEQKFDQEFSSSRYKEIWKKKTKSKISRTFISHNNNAGKLLTNWLKKLSNK